MRTVAAHTVAELAADSGYASQHAYATLDALRTVALIPPQPGAKHRGRARARAGAHRDRT